ncbi:hypothetical protein [Dactylosporangium sp. NPDC005555]|uniref:hypothetical protein n=1 Tax=Dactylosporangium sp. NPDC005555 TaxID=3154889 RepID=UPI0033AE64CF
MQAMEFHAVEGDSTPLAKLTLEPPELRERLGLRFLEVDSGLGPVLFAFGQLADGTVIGFSRLIGDERYPGTELYQYAGRRPLDVLTELLFETGLDHDEVSWLTAPPLDEDELLWARSRAEADTYLRLQAAFEDRPEDPVEDAVDAEVDGHPVVRCHDVELHLLSPSGGTTQSSKIIDPGGWLAIAFQRAGSGQHRRAAEAVGEALRFLPPGTDRLPVRLFWTPVGLRTLRQHPHLFNRGALEATLAEYEAAAERSGQTYGSPS